MEGALWVLVTLFGIMSSLLCWHLGRIRLAINGSTYASMLTWLQSPRIVTARAEVFQLNKDDAENWDSDQRTSAEEVGRTFDSVCLAAEHGLIHKGVFLEGWGSAMEKSHRILCNFAEAEATRRGYDSIWPSFQRLAQEARDSIGGESRPLSETTGKNLKQQA